MRGESMRFPERLPEVSKLTNLFGTGYNVFEDKRKMFFCMRKRVYLATDHPLADSSDI